MGNNNINSMNGVFVTILKIAQPCELSLVKRKKNNETLHYLKHPKGWLFYTKDSLIKNFRG